MKNVWKIVVGLVVGVVGMVGVSGKVLAIPGDLDPTFGDGGKVTTDFSGNSDNIDVVVEQSDGRILVGGSTFAGQGRMALARYNLNGTLDESFGLDGKIVLDLGLAGVSDVKVVGDKILVVGTMSYYNPYYTPGSSAKMYLNHVLLLRLNLNGTLDTTFGNGGYTVSNFGSSVNEVGNAIALQTDGKIIVSGYRETLDRFYQLSGRDFMTLRYNSDGVLDPTFGSGGIVTTLMAGGSLSMATDVVVQPDGKIVVVGSVLRSTTSDFGLARYNQDGSLDQGFGISGQVVMIFNGYIGNTGALISWGGSISSVTLQSDGKLVAGGATGAVNQQQNFALARFNSSGSLDTGFGNAGKVMTNFSGYYATASDIVLQTDGSILLGGSVSAGATDKNFAVAKYSSNGVLDQTFGTGGKVTLDFYNSSDVASSMTLTSEKDIVMAGSIERSQPYVPSDFAILKIQGIVRNQAPSSDAGMDKIVSEGSNISFDGLGSSDPDGVGDIVSYNWDFGDGTSGSGVGVSHTYADEGVYTATLTVMDTAGNLASDTATVTVSNVAPVVGTLSTVDSVLPGVTLTTSANFSDPGVNDTQTATFDWGDGNSSAGMVSGGVASGSHSYAVPGSYIITLIVTDDDGGSGTVTTGVTILTPVQATQNLIGLVQTFNLQQGIENSLDAKLDAAVEALNDINANNDVAAVNALQAFMNAVEAQRGSKITDAQADEMVVRVNQILSNL